MMQNSNSDITEPYYNWVIVSFNGHIIDSYFFVLDFCLGHLTKGFKICYEAGFCQPTIPQRPSSHFRD
jgi:hypothetical protein